MPKLNDHQRRYLREYQATPEWLSWAAEFDSNPDRAYCSCPRGDWILRVAEERGVDRAELVKVAAPLLAEFAERYLDASVYKRASGYAVEWAHGELEEGEAHQAAHEAQAAAAMMEAAGHLAHASAHICIHAAQAVSCCIRAAEQADFGLGRDQGRKAAEHRTAGYVRERLPLDRILK